MARKIDYEDVDNSGLIIQREIAEANKQTRFAQKTHKQLLRFYQEAFKDKSLTAAMIWVEREFGACFSKEELTKRLAELLDDSWDDPSLALFLKR